jgi:hypothetical protein
MCTDGRSISGARRPIEVNRELETAGGQGGARKVWYCALGLMNGAGTLKSQPRIARDVERLLGVFDLFNPAATSNTRPCTCVGGTSS